MWGSIALDATRAVRTLRALPGLERADFPLALLLPASFALQPGLRTAGHEACQEIAARLAITCVRGGDWRNRPTRSGAWILPRHAGVLFAAAEHCTGRGPRIGEIGIWRQLDGFLGTRRRCDRAGALGAASEQGVKVAGQAAT